MKNKEIIINCGGHKSQHIRNSIIAATDKLNEKSFNGIGLQITFMHFLGNNKPYKFVFAYDENEMEMTGIFEKYHENSVIKLNPLINKFLAIEMIKNAIREYLIATLEI